MKRLCVAIFLVAASSALPVDPAWNRSAFAQGETTAREAFEAAKELGTPAAWNAFLASFPNGFYADLARAYLKNLGESGGGAAAAPAATPVPAGSGSAPTETPKVELGANANLNGVRLLPDDSPWYQDISKAPVDRNSARILARSRQQAAASRFRSRVGGRADRHPLRRRARHADESPGGVQVRRRKRSRSLSDPARGADRRRAERRR